jgi:hypothetical protein
MVIWAITHAVFPITRGDISNETECLHVETVTAMLNAVSDKGYDYIPREMARNRLRLKESVTADVINRQHAERPGISTTNQQVSTNSYCHF